MFFLSIWNIYIDIPCRYISCKHRILFCKLPWLCSDTSDVKLDSHAQMFLFRVDTTILLPLSLSLIHCENVMVENGRKWQNNNR